MRIHSHAQMHSPMHSVNANVTANANSHSQPMQPFALPLPLPFDLPPAMPAMSTSMRRSPRASSDSKIDMARCVNMHDTKEIWTSALRSLVERRSAQSLRYLRVLREGNGERRVCVVRYDDA